MPARSQECNPRTGRRARVLGPLLVVGLIAAALLAGPSQLAAQGPGPPPEALEKLEQVNDKILRAKNENDRGAEDKVHRLILDAQGRKLGFIETGFRGQDIHGCFAGLLLTQLDLIDSNLAAAIAGGDALRKGALLNAEALARRLAKEVDECAGQRERGIAGQIRKAVDRLLDQEKSGTLKNEELRKGAEGISKLKRTLIADQQVYGCDVLEIFVLIERIDKSLASALSVRDDAVKLRASLLRKAAKDAGALIERWRMVPCGETPPPEPTAFTVEDRLSWFHVNGFGVPPSRECNFVSTSPAQPGAQVTDVISRPSPQPQVTKTATTDGNGDAVISMNIDQTGTYTHQTTVTSQGGVQATDTESQTVTSAATGANGQCPAPTP